MNKYKRLDFTKLEYECLIEIIDFDSQVRAIFDGVDFSLTTPSDQLGNRSPVLSDDDFLHGYPPAMRINVLSSSVCSQTRELAR